MNKYQKKLIIIGDSGVYGWGDLEGGGWSERLRQNWLNICLLYTSPSPRDRQKSRMPSSA